MSNEYKDWERDKIEEEKQIVAEYPFLHLRDVDGTIDTKSKFPMMGLELPDGWYRLFFQMCGDIKPILEKEGLMDDFYFFQVKEKYNRLTCYYSNNTPLAVKEIIAKYEHMAHYVCSHCGKPATYETNDYVLSVCDDCWKDYIRHLSVKQIEFKPYFKIDSVTEGVHFDEKTISFESEWNRYIKSIEVKK